MISKQTAWSLQKRLVLAFGVLLILFLGLAAVVLVQAYKESVAAAVEERLQLQIYALLGIAEPEGSSGFFVPDPEEARFSQIDSGLYAFILDGDGNEVWRSKSSINLIIDNDLFFQSEISTGETLYGSLELEGQGDLVWASYATFWESHNQTFSFIILESTEPSAAQVRIYQSTLYLWFGALAVFLSIAQYALLRWGMRPLQQLATEVAAIESGHRDQLESRYPSELKTVADNLNLLIKSERERQSRYRTTLGDLAHSLKTPLAVLSSALQESKNSEALSNEQRCDMEEQLARMDEIVSYQLKRAVKSPQAAVLVKPVNVGEVVQRLLSALNKVYQDKGIKVETDIAEHAQFYGEESDLMELCGNILDNAFKYGRSRIEIKISQVMQLLTVEVNDDGEGIAEQHREWVLQRGARADTVASGQGIGLAVAVDIVSAYGGEIQVSQNAMGGARFVVSFGQPSKLS